MTRGVLVTFGQSFQWTDRERVAEAVYDIAEPGGALALIVHAHEGRPAPSGPGYPLIPHDEIHELIRRYLGPRRRAGRGFRNDPPDRYEGALALPRSTRCRSRRRTSSANGATRSKPTSAHCWRRARRRGCSGTGPATPG